jgi:hypothetical protein
MGFQKPRSIAECHKRLWDFFEANAGEFGAVENIRPARRLHERHDLNALLLLDRLANGDGERILRGNELDLVHLNVDLVALVDVASDEDLLDLARCGVFVCEDEHAIAMFT